MLSALPNLPPSRHDARYLFCPPAPPPPFSPSFHSFTPEQLLALTTTDGSFFLGTLSKNSCWLRNIAVTEQGQARPPPASSSSSTAAAAARTTTAGTRQPKQQPPAPVVNANAYAKHVSRGWGWRLLGTGRGAVAAAATAAAEAISTSLAAAERDALSDVLASSRGGSGGGGPTRSSDKSVASDGGGSGGDAAVTGAVGVEFSAKGCLMAVALVDGTVLLTRVERYTSGVRCVCVGEEASERASCLVSWAEARIVWCFLLRVFVFVCVCFVGHTTTARVCVCWIDKIRLTSHVYIPVDDRRSSTRLVIKCYTPEYSIAKNQGQ